MYTERGLREPPRRRVFPLQSAIAPQRYRQPRYRQPQGSGRAASPGGKGKRRGLIGRERPSQGSGSATDNAEETDWSGGGQSQHATPTPRGGCGGTMLAWPEESDPAHTGWAPMRGAPGRGLGGQAGEVLFFCFCLPPAGTFSTRVQLRAWNTCAGKFITPHHQQINMCECVTSREQKTPYNPYS